LTYLQDIRDSIVSRNQKHLLTDILVIAILAVIAANEITAIPALLELLALQGAIITLDAMGTQTAIINHIQAKKADYVIALKANHPTLYTQVKNWFEPDQAHQFDGIQFIYDYRLEKGHHRLEKRWCSAVSLEAFGGLYQQAQSLVIQSIIMVKRVRHPSHKTTYEVQFYLSYLAADAQKIGNAIRKH
jgi:predicted transposase YbfD/YdcC